MGTSDDVDRVRSGLADFSRSDAFVDPETAANVRA